MDKITLGSYTFTENPQRMTLVESYKDVATVKTYGGTAVFQWDATIAGKDVDLEWDNLSETMYDQLRTLYVDDSTVVFDPQNGNTYNVIVKNLEGKYINYGLEDIPVREDVTLTLHILSQV